MAQALTTQVFSSRGTQTRLVTRVGTKLNASPARAWVTNQVSRRRGMAWSPPLMRLLNRSENSSTAVKME